MQNKQTNPQQQTKKTATTILSGAGITLIGALLGGAITFINEILAARFLGVALYGLFALAFVLAKIGETLSLFGLRIGVLHFIPILRSEGKNTYLSGTIIAALIMPLSAGIIISVGLWHAAPWLATEIFGKPEAQHFMRLIALAIPLMSLTEILGHITRGYGYAVYYVLIRNLIPPFVFLLLLISLHYWQAPPPGIAIALVIAYSIGFVAGIAALMKVTGIEIWHIRPQFQFRKLYGYSLPILINTVLYMVIGFTDILMLGLFRDASEVGIYRACMQVVIVFDMIAIAFNAATSHIYPVLSNQNKTAELNHAFSTSMRWITIIALPLMSVIVLNAADILALMGPSFVEGSLILSILAIGMALKCCFTNAGFMLAVSNHQGFETVNAAVAAGLNLLLNYILVPDYGGMGAVIATVTSLTILSILRILQVDFCMKVRPPGRSMLMVLIVVTAITIVLYLINTGMGIASQAGYLIMFVRIISLLTIIYLGLWWFVATEPERNKVKHVITGKLVKKKSN
jgi:O-antigen/teichoic acid export membrane protein